MLTGRVATTLVSKIIRTSNQMCQHCIHPVHENVEYNFPRILVECISMVEFCRDIRILEING